MHAEVVKGDGVRVVVREVASDRAVDNRAVARAVVLKNTGGEVRALVRAYVGNRAVGDGVVVGVYTSDGAVVRVCANNSSTNYSRS